MSAAAASLSIYTILSRYTLTMLRALTLRRRPAVTLSPARTPLEQRPLSPDVIAPLPWPAADQVVAAKVVTPGFDQDDSSRELACPAAFVPS